MWLLWLDQLRTAGLGRSVPEELCVRERQQALKLQAEVQEVATNWRLVAHSYTRKYLSGFLTVVVHFIQQFS